MKKLLSLGCLFVAVRLLAVTPVPFTESLSFSFKISGTGSASMNLYDESGSQYILATASGSTIESAMGAASLRPGKTYSLEFWGDGPPDYLMSFVPPNGYSVYVNGVATDLVGQSPGVGWFLHYYTVEIRPTGSTGGGMWGSFSGISLGKSITWEVGLGDLRTGRGAGSILFKELDLANSPNSRARLYYAAPPANVGQIVVIKDGPSNQTLRQIVTPIGFTDLVDVTGGYEIRCYIWSQVSSWNGTLYTFSGSPWKTIKVESPTANQLKITETEGSVVRVSNLTGSGSTTATGGTISYAGGNTIHTFTTNGTLTLSSSLSSVDYLVVGGGGGGGSYSSGNSGGGGGGDVNVHTAQTISAGSYSVVIGAGGAADASGSNSTFNGTTAYGGGKGGGNTAPLAGGSSGGGTVNNNTGAPPAAGSGSKVFTGGNGILGPNYDGGGGGGATAAGVQVGGAGYTAFDGNTYGGGGGGGNQSGSAPNSGGSGGGGRGGYSDGGSMAGVAGAANTGGGGGGGGADGIGGVGPGAAGGSGKVIIRYPSPTMVWTLQEGDGTTWLRTTTHTSSSPASGQRDDVAVVRTGGTTGTIVAKTKYHYVNQAWGEELDSIIADPDTAALTTSYAYYTNSANVGNYRLVKSVTAPTGGWTAYEYYDDWDHRGRVKYQFQPWLDTPSAASSASATTGHVFYYEYSTDWTGRYTRPTLREERINNTLVGKTTWSHGDNTGSGEPRAYATINSYRDSSNYQTDYTETYRADADPDFAGQLYKVTGANLTQISSSVSRGTFNTTTKAFTVSSSGDHWRELRFNGSTSSTGADSVTSFDSQSCPAVYLIPNKSTLNVTIRIAQGYVYRTATYVYTGSGNFSLMTYEDCEFDGYGHLYQCLASNGALTNYTYTNGQLTSTTDPTGTETQFTYDLIGRVATSVKKGASASGSYAAQGDITTTNTYDGTGHVTQAVTSGSSLSQTTTATYDLAGRLTQSVAPGSYTTTLAYSSGGKVVTTTLPGGATKIAEVYPDGQPKSLTGTGGIAQYTSYTLNTTPGTVTRQANFGTSSSTNLVKSTADWLGRQITEVRPGWSGSDVTSTWYYNSSGQLYKVSRPGLADTLYIYDTLGGLTREGLDVGANGTLDLSSSDRVTDHDRTFFTSSSNWWRRETTTTYATASSSTATQVGKVETQLSGFSAAGSGYTRLARTDSYDVFGNITTTYSEVANYGKMAVTTTDTPDSSTNAVQVAYNGLLMSSQDKAGITTTYGYDALGRPVTSVDPRTGTTTTAYVSGTSQVSTVTDAASIVQATYAYDSAGRVSSVKDALNKYTYTSYTNRNEVYRQWGDTTYPVEYAYDNWGHRTTMSTYRGGSGWTSSTWPGSPGTADTTTWAYQEATGLLSSKTDAASKAVSYTYTQAGQMATRAWARILTGSTHLTTTYSYSSTTGELTGVDYNDSTPDLTYTYNRLGGVATVVDTTGTRTLNYNLSGTLEMQSEDLPSFFGTRRVTYPRATSGVIGRPTGLQLGTSGSPTNDQSVTYGYDTYGRFNSFAGGGTTLAYTYTSNSNLLASIADSTSGWTQTRSYLSNRDLLDVIETKVSATSKAKFDYAHDNLGRRTSVAKTGDLYSRYGNGTQGLDTTWGYDDRSQVTSEQTKLGGSSTVLTGRDDAYAFDNIGNRSSSSGTTHNSNTANYTTNAVNQYTQRTVPGVFDVAGAAGSGTTVTVNSSSSGVTRHGEYFFKGQSLSNGSGAVFSTLAVSDGTTTTNIGAFLAGTPEAFTYDDDGNLTSDGRWDYVYDAENRLVSMQTHTALSPTPLANADARRIEFKNDYLGRRVQKTVRDGWNGSSFATVVSDEKFVYDGWNAIAKLNAASSNALVASYYWGLDWSGTLQGAGGVGGLALSVEGGNTYLPMFDGNGNVMGMVTAASVTLGGTSYSAGSIVAAYEYDAFGNTLRESGNYATSNPWRFSTKYADIETGLVYYGLRYYSPTLGRFINNDPIEERGGLNLYAFCGNNGANRWDLLGQVVPYGTSLNSNSGDGFDFDPYGGGFSGGLVINFNPGGFVPTGRSGPPARTPSGIPNYMVTPTGQVVPRLGWVAPLPANSGGYDITGHAKNTPLIHQVGDIMYIYLYDQPTNKWIPVGSVAAPPINVTPAPAAPREAPPPDGVVYAPKSNILVGLRGNQIDAHDLAISQLNQLRTMRTSAHNLLTEAAKIIQQIDASGGIVTLLPGRGLDPYTKPEKTNTGAGTYSVIEYDPFAPEALINLAHELVHGRDFALGTYQSGDFWHMEAYRVQNQIANELGIPIQTQWGNREDPVIITDPYRYVDRPDPVNQVPVNQGPVNRTGGRDGSTINER